MSISNFKSNVFEEIYKKDDVYCYFCDCGGDDGVPSSRGHQCAIVGKEEVNVFLIGR